MTTQPEFLIVGNYLYKLAVPMFQAGDRTVDKQFVETLREFLHRHGVNVSAITDDELVKAAREGVESRHYQTTSKGERK